MSLSPTEVDATAARVAELDACVQRVSHPTGALRDSLVALRAHLEQLQETIDARLFPCQLLELPPEILLRVLAQCDSHSIAALECTARFGSTRYPHAMMQRAVESAARSQHGPRLAALLPKNRPASQRLLGLEDARDESIYFVRAPDWPEGCVPGAAREASAYAVAVVQHATSDANWLGKGEKSTADTRHRAVVQMCCALVRGESYNKLPRAKSPEAMQWLADELGAANRTEAQRDFVLQQAWALLDELYHKSSSGDVLYSSEYRKLDSYLEKQEEAVLLRAVWRHLSEGPRDAETAERETMRETQRLLSALRLLHHYDKLFYRKNPDQLKLLTEIHEAQMLRPRDWEDESPKSVGKHASGAPWQWYVSRRAIWLRLVEQLTDAKRCHDAAKLALAFADEYQARADSGVPRALACAADGLDEQGRYAEAEVLWRRAVEIAHAQAGCSEAYVCCGGSLVYSLVAGGKLEAAVTLQQELARNCQARLAEERARTKLRGIGEDDHAFVTDPARYLEEADGPNWFELAVASLTGHIPREESEGGYQPVVPVFREGLGLYQLLQRCGRPADAAALGDDMLDHLFQWLAGGWSGVWYGGYYEDAQTPLTGWQGCRKWMEAQLGVETVHAAMEERLACEVEMRAQSLGKTHASTLRVKGRLAFTLREHGKEDEARVVLEEAIEEYGGPCVRRERREGIEGARARDAYKTTHALKALLMSQGLRAEADALIDRADDRCHDQGTIEMGQGIRRFYEAVNRGDGKEAEAALREAADVQENYSEQIQHWFLLLLGTWLAWAGRHEDAEAPLRKVMERNCNLSKCSFRPPDADKAEFRLATTLVMLGRSSEAREIIEATLSRPYLASDSPPLLLVCKWYLAEAFAGEAIEKRADYQQRLQARPPPRLPRQPRLILASTRASHSRRHVRYSCAGGRRIEPVTARAALWGPREAGAGDQPGQGGRCGVGGRRRRR